MRADGACCILGFMDWLKNLFVTPAEAADEPATRAEIVGGCVFIAAVVVVWLIDLLR